MGRDDKPLVLLHGEVRSPPFTTQGRCEAGYLLRRLQAGEKLSLPAARPMPGIAPRCLELRITDRTVAWRIVVRIDPDAILIVDVFRKKTQRTPHSVIEACRQRLRAYDRT